MKISIIGAGPGGYETAIYAASKGAEVILFNGGKLGGTCLNEGCIPTKTFCHYSENSTYEDAFEKKEGVILRLRKGVQYLLNNSNIKVVNSFASIKDSNTIVSEGIEYATDYIIIATGSKPASLHLPGSDESYIYDSTDILNMQKMPSNLSVIGGGVIGLEIASYMNNFGCEVSVYEYADSIIPNFDKEVSDKLEASLSLKGINIHTSTKVESVEDGCIAYSKNGETLYDETDNILIATGRKPNTEGLFCEGFSVAMNRDAILVNDNIKTSLPNVYAIGDVNGLQMLAHVAAFQGKRAVNHIFGSKDSINFNIVPAVVYTDPEVASVGLTEEQCVAHGYSIEVHKADFIGNGRAVSMSRTDGFAKVIINKTDNRILGGHIIGHNASELIQELVVMMNCGMTLEQCKSIIHAHPTFSEIIQLSINN